MTSYPGDVPREVFAPGGAARGTRQSPSGTFFLPGRLQRTARSYFNCQSPKKTVPRSSIEVTARGGRKETEKDTEQINLSLRRRRLEEEIREVDARVSDPLLAQATNALVPGNS